MSKICKSNPYSNCKVYNKDGDLMFRCSAKKIRWYLERDLAEPLAKNAIKLKIDTKGPGHVGDNFFLQDKHNRCTICGSARKLTRHHIVPECYRKHFPDEVKSHASYDVTVLCVCCHEAYEKSAWQYKQILAKKFNCPMDGLGEKYNKKMLRAKRNSGTLKFYQHQMPQQRIEFLLAPIREYLQKQDITREEIENLYRAPLPTNPDYISHGQYVVSKIDDLQGFVREWREHFVSFMNPQYLPEGWDVNRSIFRD